MSATSGRNTKRKVRFEGNGERRENHTGTGFNPMGERAVLNVGLVGYGGAASWATMLRPQGNGLDTSDKDLATARRSTPDS